MLGAIIGDIIGSVYESHNIKTTEFQLFGRYCRPTDDSVMSIAVAEGLISSWGQSDDEIRKAVIKSMQYYGRKYPRAGYGGSFRRWIAANYPRPYNSWGNGSAMRVSSVAWMFDNLDEVMHVAKLTAEVTHNHPEGIKGAVAIASAIFLARSNKNKKDIKDFIEYNFDYDLNTTLDVIRAYYSFDVSCQGSVPQAIRAFLESDSYESAVRLAISIGGDSDTIACMAGAIAEAYYGIPEEIKENGIACMDDFLKSRVKIFQSFISRKGRKQVISEFADMRIDMDYVLCIPAVYAKYKDENITIDFGGRIREKSEGFPVEKISLLIEWVELHSDEIVKNHLKCGQQDYPLNLIDPLYL